MIKPSFITAALLICFTHTTAAHGQLIEQFRNVVDQMRAATKVTFPDIRISAIERWEIEHPNGTVALGTILRFDRGESSEALSKCLDKREKYQTFLLSKKKVAKALMQDIRLLQSQIAAQNNVERQAQLAGVGFNSSVRDGLLSRQSGLLLQVRNAESEYEQMLNELRKLEGPVLSSWNLLLRYYQAAFTLLLEATPAELGAMAGIVSKSASSPEGYAESVLWCVAAIRSGADQLPSTLAMKNHSATMRSSNELGFSPINMDRMTMGILCESGEDLESVVKLVKKSTSANKDPSALCFLGTYHLSKRKISDAQRLFRSARLKVKDHSYARAVVAAEIVFLDLCSSSKKDLGDVAKLIDELDDAPDTNDWRLLRAKAAVAFLKGDKKDALAKVQAASVVAPSMGRRVLNDMAIEFENNKMFVLK